MNISFIIDQISLYAAIAFLIFLPGYAFMKAFWGVKLPFSEMEAFVFSFVLGLVSLDAIMLLMGKMLVPITKISLIICVTVFISLCCGVFFFRRKKISAQAPYAQKAFSRLQLLSIGLILLLTIFIKAIYLGGAILPSATDLGHHSYWAKSIALTGKLPLYEKVDINLNSQITPPGPIADFIIGEHLPLAAINLLSGINFISYFPAVVLFLIHIMALLSLFILSKILFEKSKNANTIAILTLFFIGPLYALASPQMKFVSGGVVGNTIGNLLIPTVLYFLARSLSEKSTPFLAVAIFFIFGLAYTHHLSMFVLLFIILFSGIFFALLNMRTFLKHFKDWASLIFSFPVLVTLFMGILFIFFIYMPTYLNTKAVGTAVGTPTKNTRTGLTLYELATTTGEVRMGLGIVAIIALFASRKRKSYEYSMVLGWSGALVIMSYAPKLLLVNIPTNRVASYIVFPFSLLAGYAAAKVFQSISNTEGETNSLHPRFLLAFVFITATFAATDGMRDNAYTLNTTESPLPVLETYHAAAYLSEKTSSSDIILKDHNYLAADSWIKLSFMRGYNYPLSRGYFKRYEDETKQREQCTNLMISTPNTPEAEKCFAGTKTDYLIVNPNMDSTQFRKSNNFSQVYAADDVMIYYKNN